MEEEGKGRKAMDLASERKKNGWTHVESAGCHGGLLSEGHRQYMKHDGAKLDFRCKQMGTS